MQSACPGDLKDINVITSLYLKKCPGDRKDKNVLRYYILENVVGFIITLYFNLLYI